MKICRKNYHGYKQVSDDYNLVDVNKYSNKELLEDNLIITKAMTLEKCKSKEELKINLLEIINCIEGDEYLNKIERMIKLILKNTLDDNETSNVLEKIKDKKKGLYSMLAILERIEIEEKRRREKCKREGINNTKLEIAKEMLKEKIDINKISKCTKLNKKVIEKIQKDFEGEAERLNLKTEDDVVKLIKEFRKERKNENIES